MEVVLFVEEPDVVAGVELEPTAASPPEVLDELVADVADVVAGAMASAVVPPTTPTAATEAAMMRDRRVRLQRRRVAVLIRGRFMAPRCAACVG